MNQKTILSRLAAAEPESTDIRTILAAMDDCLATMPAAEQFDFAGTVLEQLASLEARKAALFAEEWEQLTNPTEPILEDDSDLFVQNQQIRSGWQDSLMSEPLAHYYPKNRKRATRGAVVEAPATPPSLAAIASLAYEESVSDWVRRVQAVLGESTLSLTQLQAVTGLSIVPLWLAVLFGGFSVKREGDFYEGEIFVSSATLDAL